MQNITITTRSVFSIYGHTYFPLLFMPPAITKLSCILIILSFQECYTNAIIQNVNLWDGLFIQHNCMEIHPGFCMLINSKVLLFSFFLKIIISTRGPLPCHINFIGLDCICKNSCWDFDRNYMTYAHQFGKDWLLFYAESSHSEIQYISLLISIF